MCVSGIPQSRLKIFEFEGGVAYCHGEVVEGLWIAYSP